MRKREARWPPCRLDADPRGSTLGEAHAAAGHPAEAIAAYRRTLDVDPTFTRAYLSLSRALLARGDRDEALRYLRHGAKAAAKPDQVRDALQHAEAETGAPLP